MSAVFRTGEICSAASALHHGHAAFAHWFYGDRAASMTSLLQTIWASLSVYILRDTRLKCTEPIAAVERLVKDLKLSSVQKRRIMGIVFDDSEDNTKQGLLSAGVRLLTACKTDNVYDAIKFYDSAKRMPEMQDLCKALYDSYDMAKYHVPRYDHALEQQPTEREAEAYLVKEPKIIKPRVVPEVKERKTVKVAEATQDTAALDIATQVLKPRMCRATFIDDDAATAGTLNGIAIKGTLILLPFHMFFSSQTGQPRERGKINFKFGVETSTWIKPPVEVTLQFDPARIKYQKGDWCLYDVGNVIQSYRDISHLFVREKDLSLLSEFEGQLLIKSEQTFSAIETTIRPSYTPVTYTQGPRDIRMMRGWEYKANTSAGDCGAPLVAYVPSLVGKILGIHVCGTRATSRANSELITFEDLEVALAGC